jgi:hypothetical protein
MDLPTGCPSWARSYLRDRGDGVPAVLVADDAAWARGELMDLATYYARYQGKQHRAVRVDGLRLRGG